MYELCDKKDLPLAGKSVRLQRRVARLEEVLSFLNPSVVVSERLVRVRMHTRSHSRTTKQTNSLVLRGIRRKERFSMQNVNSMLPEQESVHRGQEVVPQRQGSDVRKRKTGFLAVCFICCCSFFLTESASASGTADLYPQDFSLQLLESGDAALYREIFALQERKRWSEADRKIRRINNPVLMGHVLAQRYLHPTGWRSSYRELKAWMSVYSGHPQADRIYALAMRRRPSGAAAPKRPTAKLMPLYSVGDSENAVVSLYRSRKSRTPAEKRRVQKINAQVRKNVLRQYFTVTERMLASREIQQLLDHAEIDRNYSEISAGWYYYGQPRKALSLAGKAAGRSGGHAPMALWIAGLASWRLQKYQDAQKYFTKLFSAPLATERQKAAAAFWTARSMLRLQQPHEVHQWLRQAAQHPRTFYGILAQEALGVPSALFPFRVQRPPVEQSSLLKHAAGRRTLALLQVGQVKQAQEELRRFPQSNSSESLYVLLRLVEYSSMPNLALRLGFHALYENRKRPHQKIDVVPINSALFPLPPWKPAGGRTIDRALLYAMMRQESAFNPNAKSHDGARGLMQLLPSTAYFIDQRKLYRGKSRDSLYQPELNLRLGEDYINHLQGLSYIEGDLIRTLVAYNGGPGNLLKWGRKTKDVSDPLLYIESLPSRETRAFVTKVMRNLWAYRDRLNQPRLSARALLAGQSPLYISLDTHRPNTYEQVTQLSSDTRERVHMRSLGATQRPLATDKSDVLFRGRSYQRTKTTMMHSEAFRMAACGKNVLALTASPENLHDVWSEPCVNFCTSNPCPPEKPAPARPKS